MQVGIADENQMNVLNNRLGLRFLCISGIMPGWPANNHAFLLAIACVGGKVCVCLLKAACDYGAAPHL